MLVSGLAEASFTLLAAPLAGRYERQEVSLLDVALPPETSIEDRQQRPEALLPQERTLHPRLLIFSNTFHFGICLVLLNRLKLCKMSKERWRRLLKEAPWN
jgi:nitrate reductase gamma subunit